MAWLATRHVSFAAAARRAGTPEPTARRRLPAPLRRAFDALSARLALRPLPGARRRDVTSTRSPGCRGRSPCSAWPALYRMVAVVVGFAERRSNFVAAVSHELKTPLTAIRMYGEMLRDGMVPSEAKRDEYHRHITVGVRAPQPPHQQRARVLAPARRARARSGSSVDRPRAPVVARWRTLVGPTSREQGFELRARARRQISRRCASSATR